MTGWGPFRLTGRAVLALLLAAGVLAQAGPASAQKRGGTLTIVSRSDFDYADSGLAYFSHSWNMMSATNLTLTYYPHTEAAVGGRLTGMAAPLPRVSNGGRTYTFTVKKGFKFNTGQAVTAANFKRAFDRGLNKTMQSPASSFMDDVASYKANGQVFTVTLKKVSCGTELTVVQEGVPDVIPAEQCYLGWQESLAQLANLVDPEIPG